MTSVLIGSVYYIENQFGLRGLARRKNTLSDLSEDSIFEFNSVNTEYRAGSSIYGV